MRPIAPPDCRRSRSTTTSQSHPLASRCWTSDQARAPPRSLATPSSSIGAATQRATRLVCVWGGGRGRGCTGAAVRAGVLRHNQLLSSSRARQARKQHSRGSTHTLVGPAVTAVLSTPAPTLPKCPAVSCCVGAAVLQGKRIDNTSVRDEPYLFVLGGQQVRRREAHTASTSPLPLPGWHPACPVHLAHTPSMHCPWVCCTEAAH